MNEQSDSIFSNKFLWIALIFGIILGQFLSELMRSCVSKKEKKTDASEDNWATDSASDSDEDEDGCKSTKNSVKDQVLKEKYPLNDDLKMIFAVRTDLGMTKGKMCAQCGHATLGAYTTCQKWGSKSKYWKGLLKRWSLEGQKKIAVKVTSEQEM